MGLGLSDVQVSLRGLAPPAAVVLNAGAQLTDRRRRTVQGHELTFGINVVAQHALLRGLEPVLAEGAHVILLGSSTHRGRRASFGLVPDPRWREPAAIADPDRAAADRPHPPADRHRGGEAYATSKLALVTLSHDWAERLAATGRRLNCYDPGLVAGTGLGKDMPGYRYWIWKHLMPVMSMLPGATTPARTARHAVALALGDTHPDLNDGYLEMGRITTAEANTFDTDRRVALWTWLQAATDAITATDADHADGADDTDAALTFSPDSTATSG